MVDLQSTALPLGYGAIVTAVTLTVPTNIATTISADKGAKVACLSGLSELSAL